MRPRPRRFVRSASRSWQLGVERQGRPPAAASCPAPLRWEHPQSSGAGVWAGRPRPRRQSFLGRLVCPPSGSRCLTPRVRSATGLPGQRRVLRQRGGGTNRLSTGIAGPASERRAALAASAAPESDESPEGVPSVGGHLRRFATCGAPRSQRPAESDCRSARPTSQGAARGTSWRAAGESVGGRRASQPGESIKARRGSRSDSGT
jgi:hypothetical protein